MWRSQVIIVHILLYCYAVKCFIPLYYFSMVGYRIILVGYCVTHWKVGEHHVLTIYQLYQLVHIIFIPGILC